MIRPALLAALGLGLCRGEALASSFCLIPKTPDGFVALRAGPRSDARLILKMKPEDEVQIVASRHGSWEQAGIGPATGGWPRAMAASPKAMSRGVS